MPTAWPNSTTRVFFYDTSGRLLTQWDITINSSGDVASSPVSASASYQYFAGQRVGQWTDRLGSTRYTSSGSAYAHYYPYGEEITSTSNDTYKFAQTYRDSDSGLDYAMHRYYASGLGRFLTVDPKGRSARRNLPQSWNRYIYVLGDPANYRDPRGLDGCPDDDDDDSSD